MVTLISYACILVGMIRVQFFFVSGSLPIEKPDFQGGLLFVFVVRISLDS